MHHEGHSIETKLIHAGSARPRHAGALSIGGVESLIVRPAAAVHPNLSAAERADGISKQGHGVRTPAM
jgi:hypothetical protein